MATMDKNILIAMDGSEFALTTEQPANFVPIHPQHSQATWWLFVISTRHI
jgi:hypothetical protein